MGCHFQFAAIGYYMSDSKINALFKDTSKDVKCVCYSQKYCFAYIGVKSVREGWTNMAGKVSAALATTVGTMYDAWMTEKVTNAESYVTSVCMREVPLWLPLTDGAL